MEWGTSSPLFRVTNTGERKVGIRGRTKQGRETKESKGSKGDKMKGRRKRWTRVGMSGEKKKNE